MTVEYVKSATFVPLCSYISETISDMPSAINGKSLFGTMLGQYYQTFCTPSYTFLANSNLLHTLDLESCVPKVGLSLKKTTIPANVDKPRDSTHAWSQKCDME